MQNKSLKDAEKWDIYWDNQKVKKGFYEIIAEIYRKFIIKKTLNYFILKHFKKKSKLLHAGCGSGRVDEDISRFMSITALDISKKALSLYSKINGYNSKTVHGSIFDIPAKDNTFDGVYNLGVMEHFTLEDIDKILSEFRRVLKPKKKMVLFWPPRYGLTVISLRFIHTFINFLSKKTVSLHPSEVSLVQSKSQVTSLIEKSGFKVIEYYFGPQDIFTQCVIVAIKKP